jgi:hypothetical protein
MPRRAVRHMRVPPYLNPGLHPLVPDAPLSLDTVRPDGYCPGLIRRYGPPVRKRREVRPSRVVDPGTTFIAANRPYRLAAGWLSLRAAGDRVGGT